MHLLHCVRLSKTNRVTKTAITTGIPIPSAMPSSVEIPFNGADDGEDEDVGDCIVVEDKVIVGTNIGSKFVVEDNAD